MTVIATGLRPPRHARRRREAPGVPSRRASARPSVRRRRTSSTCPRSCATTDRRRLSRRHEVLRRSGCRRRAALLEADGILRCADGGEARLRSRLFRQSSRARRRASIRARADAAADAALRAPRRPRRADGSLRRLGDARPVRGRRSPSTAPCARDCGVFDVSHMGELEVEGPRAHELLQSPALERPRPDRRRRRPVHAADERARRRSSTT